jgi:hypothetical protein
VFYPCLPLPQANPVFCTCLPLRQANAAFCPCLPLPQANPPIWRIFRPFVSQKGQFQPFARENGTFLRLA